MKDWTVRWLIWVAIIATEMSEGDSSERMIFARAAPFVAGVCFFVVAFGLLFSAIFFSAGWQVAALAGVFFVAYMAVGLGLFFAERADSTLPPDTPWYKGGPW